jgi:hypothetical protein
MEKNEISEIASWLEIPLMHDIPVTPMDLLESNRYDLVFDFAGGHATAKQVLDEWDENWREKFRSNFEVFLASDGQFSIREKSD